MNMRFHIDFKGTNEMTFDVEHEPNTPDEFQQMIFAIKKLVMEFRHT